MNALQRKVRYRIGIDARMYRQITGGIGRYTRELLHHLFLIDQQNDYVVFLTQNDLVEWDIDLPNVRPVVVGVAHYDPVKEQAHFLRELYKHHLDLVHFLNFNHPLLYRKPFVVTLHNLTMFLFPTHGVKKPTLLKRAGFQIIFRRAMRAAKKVIAISEFSAFDAEDRLHVPHAKMEVIYEGGPEPLTFLSGSKEVAQRYIGTRDPYFLFVGQWRPHKGLKTLIDAFDLFKRETGLPHKLVLVGNSEAASDEVRKALVDNPSAGDIIAPGFAPDDLLPVVYHYATCFIMPSEYEGFSLPILEAFANGTPVVAANNSSIPEVVGDAGLMFETGDSISLADHMKRIATDQAFRDALLAKGPRQLQRFSWDECATQTLAVYQAVLEKMR